MATPLLDLIRAILPNFNDRQLRQMVPWFERISALLDNIPIGLHAAAYVDAGGTMQGGYGFEPIVTHPTAGNYTLKYLMASNPSETILLATPTSPGAPPAGAITVYASHAGSLNAVVNIWQVASPSAAQTQVNQAFFIAAIKTAPFITPS